MNSPDQKKRINRLEILFSEQEYTIETLNSVVTKQAQDIDQLSLEIELLKHNLKELKKQIPETEIVDEKPPHY